MRVKKSRGKIFGAELTSAEKKAMDLEIEKQLAIWDRKNAIELSSLSLWILHEEFGFGPERLKRFYDAFSTGINELCKRYDMDDGTNDSKAFLCTHKLKEYGIDLDEWGKDVKK